MTTVQWLGVSLFAAVFVGSLGLGRYLRYRDDKRIRNQIVVQPIRRRTPSHDGPGFVYSADDIDQLVNFMAAYHAEVERIAAGYHQRLMLEGEEAAQLWLDQQTGHRPKSTEREGR
jgi:hypothetical protein